MNLTTVVATVPAKGAQVDVLEVRTDAGALVGFEVRSTTGFLAVATEVHTECDRMVCVKPRNHGSYVQTRGHCHGLHHLEQVVALAHAVADTYGNAHKAKVDASSNRPTPRGGWTGSKVMPMPTSLWAETEWSLSMERATS